MFEIIVEKEGMKFLGWREVPIQPDIAGRERRWSCMPCIEQGFVERPARPVPGDWTLTGQLYVARREFEQSDDDTYVRVPAPAAPLSIRACSWWASCGKFYPDLQDADYESAIAMVHSRFSTNTNPSWERAHPNRFILHNGEINTIRGNADRMLAREETMSSDCMGADDLDKVFPVVNAEGSDSAMLDNTLEFMVMSGMDSAAGCDGHAFRSPGATIETMCRAKRDLYQYYATMMEPWDGPASILFSDGDCGGRRAGPQRPAPLPVLYHRRRPADSLLRGGRSGDCAGEDRQEIPPAARQNAAGGHGGRPAYRRR